MDATTVAVDLAKDIFEVALANRAGRILNRQRLTRRQFERFVDGLPSGNDGGDKAAIALANKLARIIWAVWSRDTDFCWPAAQAA